MADAQTGRPPGLVGPTVSLFGTGRGILHSGLDRIKESTHRTKQNTYRKRENQGMDIRSREDYFKSVQMYVHTEIE